MARAPKPDSPWEDPTYKPPTGAWAPPTFSAEGKGSQERTRLERLDLLWRERDGDRVSDVFRSTGEYGREKLRKIRGYVYSYSVILNTHFPHKFAYIDGEAGPGFLTIGDVPDPKQRTLFDNSPAKPKVVLGSPFLALSNYPNFPSIHLVELDKKIHEALQKRVDHYYPGRAEVTRGDCNVEVPKIAAGLPAGTKAFFFLDPMGLELEMDTIRATAKACPGAELLILYPYHMAVRRCLNHAQSEGALDAFFGDDTWKKIRDAVDASQGKYDKESILLQLYMAKVKAAGFKHVVATDTVSADDGRDLYYLIFATNNSTGLKIFVDIETRSKGKA